MSGFIKRAVAVLAGVVLGIVIVAGAGSWQLARQKPDPGPTPPASVPHERAPDTRV